MSAGTGEALRQNGAEGSGEGARQQQGGQVYDDLKEAILPGALEPGSRSTSRRCANGSAFRAFPSPPRSAGSLSIVWSTSSRSTARSSRGSRSTDVRERLFIRRALEGEIAAEAARRLTPAGKDALAANLARGRRGGRRAGDRRRFYALDVAFHRTLTDRLGCAAPEMSRRAARASGAGAPAADDSARRFAPTLAEHRAIAGAIAAGRPRAAREAMRRHLCYRRRAARGRSQAQQPELVFAASRGRTVDISHEHSPRPAPQSADNVIIAVDEISAGGAPAGRRRRASACRAATRWRPSPIDDRRADPQIRPDHRLRLASRSRPANGCTSTIASVHDFERDYHFGEDARPRDDRCRSKSRRPSRAIGAPTARSARATISAS